MKNKEITNTSRRLDAIEIAALEPKVKKMYLARLKRQRPNLYSGVLRLVKIEEDRLLKNEMILSRRVGKGYWLEQFKQTENLLKTMEKARC